MTADVPRIAGETAPAGPSGPAADGRPAERMRMLTVGGRTMRVSVRDGDPGWPPLLLCNGIGVSLELLQPFVDALDPRRPVIRFDMPGVGGSPAPVVPYHLVTLAAAAGRPARPARLQAGRRAGHLLGRRRSRSSSRSAARTGCGAWCW